MSMERWRELKQEAEDATEAPRGDERIARCEAFLSRHPDYPELQFVLTSLVDAYLDKGDFDPAHMASLLERQSVAGSPYGPGELPEFLVGRYYFKYKLPLSSAERLLKKAWEGIAADRRALAKDTDPERRKEGLLRLEKREFMTDLAEGRVRLARGNTSSALGILLQAESLGNRTGQTGIQLREADGKLVRTLPRGSGQSDLLNLSMATAYARLGRRQEAEVRIGRVEDLIPGYYEEVGPARDALLADLGLPLVERQEIRADPKPAPEFKFKDLQGKEVALSDFRDQVVLAMFWATW